MGNRKKASHQKWKAEKWDEMGRAGSKEKAVENLQREGSG